MASLIRPAQALARENGPGNNGLENQPRVARHHGRALLANGLNAEAARVLPEAVALWQARLAEQPGDHPRRMLAWMNLQRAKARWGEGDLAVGAALAERPVVTLQALATAL